MRDGWEPRIYETMLESALQHPCRDCPLTEKCKAGMACWDFARWIDRDMRQKWMPISSERQPSRELYDHLFADKPHARLPRIARAQVRRI